MKGILQFILIVTCGCSTAHSAKSIPNKENEAMKTIQNITWIFKGENIDLFNGSDTPLNKDYEFINEKNIKFDSAKIHPSHGAPQGLVGFTLILCSDNTCRLSWKYAVPHVVTGTASISYTMIGQWKTEGATILVSYEATKNPALTRKVTDYAPKIFTHCCKMRFRIENDTLILTPVEVEAISGTHH